MAAQTLVAASINPPLVSNASPPLQSHFKGASVRVPRKAFSFSPAARALAIVAETKKAVAVLKGNSPVEGVVNLVQEENIVANLFSPPMDDSGWVCRLRAHQTDLH
eukprot:Gb_38964 [translate_table: standard]